MITKINFVNELIEKQKRLDSLIYNNSGVKWDWKSLGNFLRIKLCIIVEIGELSNEIKEFKILRKGAINLNKAREELIDCFSFFLGLVEMINIKLKDIDIEELNENKKISEDFNLLLLDFFSATEKLNYEYTPLINSYFNQWLLIFKKIALKLDMDTKEIIEIYSNKNRINYERLYKEINEKTKK